MLIVLLKSEQLGLFDAPVTVKPYIRADGVVVDAHASTRRKKLAPTPHHPRVYDLFNQEPQRTTIVHLRARPAPRAAAPKPIPPASASTGAAESAAAPTVSAVADKREISPPADKPTGGIDYSRPFDAIAVPDFGVPAGISKADRRAINADVVAMLARDQVQYSDADRATLRQYSGNGGCGDSLNEFYTDPRVAAAMWSTLHRLGLRGGTALEPSCATGVFLATAPIGVRVTGNELDGISAGAARVLHGDRHEISNASLEDFANRDGGRQFDAVIGNAPFGLRGALISEDKPELTSAEAYFLDTALDKTRAGGLVAMIVPTGVLDGRNSRAVRERLLRKGEFLGAQRMPNTAFEHSHTGVTTDVVYFRKRPDDVAGALGTVDQDALRKLGVWDDEFLSGQYFTGRGSGNVLGRMEEGWRAKAGMGQDITVVGSMAGVPEALAQFQPDDVPRPQVDMPAILGALDDDKAKARALGGSMRLPYGEGKDGDTKVVDGVNYVLRGSPLRWHRVDEVMQSEEVAEAIDLATDIDRVAEYVATGTHDTALQRGLAARVRAYVEKHGIPARNKNLVIAAGEDRRLHRLIGAVGKDGELSDLVANRARRVAGGSVDSIAQALALQADGRSFSAADLAERSAKPIDEIEDYLHASSGFAYVGGHRWTTMDAYLAGELWPKLDAARAALENTELDPALRHKLEMQAARLDEVIAPKSLEDVEIQLNSGFVPPHIVAAFFNDQKAEMAAGGNAWAGREKDMSIEFSGGLYHVTGGLYDRDLLAKYLNRTGVRKDDKPKIDQWNADFKTWLCASRYRDQVEGEYNRKFRGFVPEVFSDEPFEIPGLKTDGLKQYQYGGLRWALAAGKGIIAADVGLGKTVRALMLARMAKVTGRAKKPMIVVPKSVLANWDAEVAKWFPGDAPANLGELAERAAPGMRTLVIGETYTRDKAGKLIGKTDSSVERNRKFHDAAQNDYDLILISQPAYNDLELNPSKKGEYVEDDFWVQRGNALNQEGDARLKKIRKAREAYEQKLAQRDFDKRSDAIYFDDIGVDMLIGDEGHHYKNLYSARARWGETPKFLGGQGLSNRALDMDLKARWIREQNGGKNVYLLTATPTKNSPLEIYSMLHLIAPEAFEKIGVRNSEEFLDRYCEFAEDFYPDTTTGEITKGLVTVGFKNLDELREIMRRFIDRKTAADVGLKLPTRDDRLHAVDMTPEQKRVYAELREAAEKAAVSGDSTGDSHIFAIMDKMHKAALDLELLGGHAGAESPKFTAAAVAIAAGAKEGGQVVFCDSIATHEKIAKLLVAAGIPRERIAIMNAQEAAESAKRQNIADAFNRGDLDVVIGNKTMEEGVNLQKRTTDLHNLDLPWEPATLQQRLGRGLRQGNINEAVRNHTYIAKGSFDAYRHRSLTAKKDWQDLLWNGGDRVDNIAREFNIGRDEMMIMLAPDPESARAKFEGDKAAATARFEAGERRKASSVFVKFREMSRSYAGLKDKGSVAANRLRSKIERARTGLFANPYFHAKEALDSKTDVLLHPDSGIALRAGLGLDLPAAAKPTHTPGAAVPIPPATTGGADVDRVVVSGVNERDGTITVRPYADTHGRKATVKLADIKHPQVYAYSEAEESAEISRKLNEAASSAAGALKKYEDLKTLPEGVLRANYDGIQKQLKEGAKAYTLTFPHGDIGMLRREGAEPAAFESYEHGKQHQSHDYMLPIPEHREKALAAWLADQRGKKFTHTYVQARRGGRTEQRFVQLYPGKFDQAHNRWAAIGRELFGKDFERDARDLFEAEHVEAMRAAPDFAAALRAAAPAAEVGYDGKVTWPKKTVATLYAKAKAAGILDQPLKSHLPRHEQYGRMVDELPGELFSAAGSHSTPSVGAALKAMALTGGNRDLAAAMVVDGNADPADKVRSLGELMHGPHASADHAPVIEAIRHLAARHPEAADAPAPYHMQLQQGGYHRDGSATVAQALARFAQVPA